MLNKQIILNNIKDRRSIRKFIDKDIEQEKLDILFEAARWAPSNCNKQLWKIVVIRDNETKSKLVDKAGSSTLILKAPVVLCIVHYNDVFLEAYQTSSAVTQNISLMATELGIGTLWLNSKGNVDKIKEVLDIPEVYIISNFVLMGYFDTTKKKTAPKRKPLSNFIMYDKFKSEDKLNWSHDPAQWDYRKLREYQEYICRKTEIGTCQDIINENEIDIVKNTSKNYSDSHLDFFPYDGHILKSIEGNENITIVETSNETAEYTKATLQNENIKVELFDEIINDSDNLYNTMSINYRLERLPYETRDELFKFVYSHLQDDGSFYIVSRTNNVFYTIFYKLFIKLLGDNISKTAIYSFFGPFKPLDVKKTEKMLEKYEFKIDKKRYFFIPPIFETVAQLMYQYKKSKGGNFMHRIEKETILSKLFKLFTKIQLNMGIHFFGSIVVITAKRNKKVSCEI